MTLANWLDFAVRAAAILGLPTLIAFYVRERRRNRIVADKEEKEVPFQVRKTAATTLDAEVAAMAKAFELRAKTMQETIDDLRSDLTHAREDIDAKDKKIEELKRRVYELQDKLNEMRRQVDNLQQDFESVSAQLQSIQGHPGK
jgi:predicted RNase H-like nuclease (RuvC/YqgF family)